MGRPPAPLEHHRRVGRANGSKKADGRGLPAPADTQPLAMVEAPPDPPSDLADEALRLWARIWTSGRGWIAATDIEAVEAACRLADDIAATRREYRRRLDRPESADDVIAGGAAEYGRLLATLDKQLQAWLSQLGFTPTARSRLGVAEVKARLSVVDQLRADGPKRVAAEVLNGRPIE